MTGKTWEFPDNHEIFIFDYCDDINDIFAVKKQIGSHRCAFIASYTEEVYEVILA